VLSKRECATLYPRGLWALHRLGWRPSPAGLNPDRPGLRTPLGLLFKDTLYRLETFRRDPLMLANALDQVANTPYEATKRTSLLPHILISIHQEELLALFDSGSEVTCINEDLFAILSAKARILTMPVASTFLHCATGQQSSRIKFQAWMEFSLNDVVLHIFSCEKPDTTCNFRNGLVFAGERSIILTQIPCHLWSTIAATRCHSTSTRSFGRMKSPRRHKTRPRCHLSSCPPFLNLPR
jgi:hypothetical protein